MVHNVTVAYIWMVFGLLPGLGWPCVAESMSSWCNFCIHAPPCSLGVLMWPCVYESVSGGGHFCWYLNGVRPTTHDAWPQGLNIHTSPPSQTLPRRPTAGNSSLVFFCLFFLCVFCFVCLFFGLCFLDFCFFVFFCFFLFGTNERLSTFLFSRKCWDALGAIVAWFEAYVDSRLDVTFAYIYMVLALYSTTLLGAQCHFCLYLNGFRPTFRFFVFFLFFFCFLGFEEMNVSALSIFKEVLRRSRG